MPRSDRSGPLNDGWLDRPDPTAPLREVRVDGHPALFVYEVSRDRVPRSIPLAEQHAWFRALRAFLPVRGGVTALRGAEQCLDDGAPLPGWVQREIIAWTDAGVTPDLYRALADALADASLARHRANPRRSELTLNESGGSAIGRYLTAAHWATWAELVAAGADAVIEATVVLDGLPDFVVERAA